jgi:DNA-binding beta-propeller fold protein YncE
MMSLVRADRPAVSGFASEGGSRLGGVRCARLWVLVCVVVSLVAALPASARAADVVYWGNEIGNTISFANLDGSGGDDLATTGATMDDPLGVALDPAAGRIYWANHFGDRISFANLDGSGGGDLVATPANFTPAGVAVDRAAGRIYWANEIGDTISFANLDGSGVDDLATTGATVNGPQGVALDPAAGRIYWANRLGNTISFANLDGSGGGDLVTTGATVSQPAGVAVDRAAGRIYWANRLGNTISFANLDGSGGGNLVTTGATVFAPAGVALDPAAGRIYWANFNGQVISFARLDGSGGGDLVITGATLDFPAFPALLERPGGAGTPLVSGGSAVGATLSCSTGEWAPDLTAALLYRAPRSFAYAWSRDGATIAGAATSSLTASDPGAYRCQVTATNQAGSATQTSAPHSVAAAPAPAPVGPPPAAPAPVAPAPAAPAVPAAAAFGARTLVALELAARRIPAAGPLPVRVANGNDFAVTGVLSGQTAGKVTVPPRKPVTLKAKSFSVAAHARKTIKLALPKPLRRLLQSQRRLALRLTAKPKDPAGNTRTVTKRVTPKLKRKRGR